MDSTENREPGVSSPGRRAFLLAAWAYVAYNVLLSVVGLVAKLPDLTSTHASTDHITVSQIVFSTGTIMSPPLILVAIAGLLFWGTRVKRNLVSKACTALSLLLVLFTAIEEATGLGNRPALFSTGKWDLVIVLGVIFVMVAAAALVTGVAWTFRSLSSRSMSASAR